MFSSIKKFFHLLEKSERRSFYLLIVAMIFMGITEIVGIGSIAPFLSVVTDPDIIHEHVLLEQIYTTMNFGSTNAFIVALGFAVLFFVLFRNFTAAVVRFIEIRFAEMRGYKLSRRLMAKYLGHPYVFFLNRNSAELSRNILSESIGVINSFLIPLLELLTKLVTVIAVIAFLIIVDPQVAVIVAAALGVLYGLIYMSVKKVLLELGRKRLKANKQRFKLVRETFGGIKDIKLLGKEIVFLDRFSRVARRTARYESNKRIIGSFPKYALDSIVFGTMVGMVLYLMFNRAGGLSESVSLLGLYGLAAYRLMPALDGIFKRIAKIRGAQAIVDTLYTELEYSGMEENQLESNQLESAGTEPEKFVFNNEIRLSDIEFTYPVFVDSSESEGGGQDDKDSGVEENEPVLHEQSLVIPKNSTIGFAGPTGCGKTTLVDIILGLLVPSSGTVSVDGIPIDLHNLRNWQANLGYVPQSIYLSDDTIAANIAFGVPAKHINMEQVKKAAGIAHLAEFIETELRQGYETFVGEQGIRLSGGQRQRIGIARALYHDPEVLVLDEATSALDGITEAVVMEAIEDLAGKKTIILIAHRLSTLKDADTIFLLEKGRIIERGNYEDLIKRNSQFQQMARWNQ